MHRAIFFLLAIYLTVGLQAATNDTPSKVELLTETGWTGFKEFFHKEPRTIEEINKAYWPHLMGVAIRTLRKIGAKYAHNLEAMQSLTETGIPRGLAHLSAGTRRRHIKIIKEEGLGEWYLPIKHKGERRFPHHRIEERWEEFVSSKEHNPDPVILYIHGGAMCLCSPKTHREMLLRLAKATGRVILAVQYRKPPEHPYPAPLEDCYQAYTSLKDRGLEVVVAGDSAGGTLALTLTKRLKEERRPLPESLILISPWVDLTEWGPAEDLEKESSLTKYQNVDFLPLPSLEIFAKAYLGENQETTLEELSPVNFDVREFPKILFAHGEYEMLFDQQERFAKKLEGTVSHTWVKAPGMVHVYPIFASLGAQPAEDIFESIEDFLTSPFFKKEKDPR